MAGCAYEADIDRIISDLLEHLPPNDELWSQHHGEVACLIISNPVDGDICEVMLDYQRECVYGNKKPCLWITGVEVAEPHRRKGVFTCLMKKLLLAYPHLEGISMTPTSPEMVSWLRKHGCANVQQEMPCSVAKGAIFLEVWLFPSAANQRSAVEFNQK